MDSPPSPHSLGNPRAQPLPGKTSPVIPAKAGIHNSAPIIKQPAVYIMANKAKGVLYTSVTSNLKNRMSEHRTWLSGNSDE